MRAGALRDLVSIRRRSLAPDGGGGQEIAWLDLGERWGALKYSAPSMNAEAVDGGALEAVVRATLRLRADSVTEALSTEDVVRCRGRDWNVRQVLPEPRFGFVTVAIEHGSTL